MTTKARLFGTKDGESFLVDVKGTSVVLQIQNPTAKTRASFSPLNARILASLLLQAADSLVSPRQSAQAFHPGGYLTDELNARGLSVAELSRMSSIPPLVLESLTQGNSHVSPWIARQLAAAFGTSAETWLNLQAAFDRASVTENQ